MNDFKKPPTHEGERIAKFLSRAGIASRRASEKLILDGAVSVNDKVLTTPACIVTSKDLISVHGKIVQQDHTTKLWAFYKPRGCLTTDHDPEGRQILYDYLPQNMPRVMSVGRLDYNSEGLILLTNNGSLKRFLELPSNQILRRYRVRAHGYISQERLDMLAEGIVYEKIHYAPAYAELEKIQGHNAWINFTLSEGKNREIRKLMAYLGYEVNRLIRTDYGAFSLGKLREGHLKEIPEDYIQKKYPAFFT